MGTLKSLEEKLAGSLYETIVVENGSTENNDEVLRKSGFNIKIVNSGRNLGFAGGCNLGAQNATGDFFLFLNSDMLFGEDPLPEIINYLRDNREVSVVGYQLLNADGSLQPSYYRFPGLLMRFIQLSGIKKILLRFLPKVQPRNEKFFSADYVSGAFLMIRSETFNKIGGFDEKFFMYQEDADLCYRANQLGEKVVVYNGRNIFHLNENHEVLTNEFVFRNMHKGQIIFYKKHYGRMSFLLLTLMTLFFYEIQFIYYKVFKSSEYQAANNLRMAMRLYLRALMSGSY